MRSAFSLDDEKHLQASGFVSWNLADVGILAREFSQKETPIDFVSRPRVNGKIKSQTLSDTDPRNPLEDIPPILFLPPAHIFLSHLKVVGVL